MIMDIKWSHTKFMVYVMVLRLRISMYFLRVIFELCTFITHTILLNIKMQYCRCTRLTHFYFSKRLILRRLSWMMNVVILYSIVKHIYCVYTFRRMLGCIKSLESQLLHTMMVTMTIMEAVITMMLFIFF